MPKSLTLTIIDTSGIQRYVFGNNKLKHNIGASYLVECATGDWVDETLKALGKHSLGDHQGEIERDDTLLAEKIYSGGGNTVLLFRSEAVAQDFTYRLTKKVLQEAPGLQLVITHAAFDWQTSLATAVQAIIEQVNEKKARFEPSMSLLGIAVTADCVYTGAPAVELGRADFGERRPRISAEIKAKEDVAEKANSRLKADMALPDGYTIPLEIDQLGRTTGESSYIAVVHADGNDMGKRVKGIAEKIEGKGNRAYIQAMRDFSNSIREASKQAMQALAICLIDSVSEGKIGEKITLSKDGNMTNLPFRPLVMGGDDVTFVCDGRLGLSLAALYLQTVQQTTLSDGQPLWSRAGVAVVKSHYPFARAYDLAEELCKSARKRTKDIKTYQAYMLDWHFAVSGPVRSLDNIRRDEYQYDKDKVGSLLMRPVDVCAPEESDWRTWEVLTRQMYEFTEGEWAGKRNKVKALREALRGGEKEVKLFLKAYNLSNLPKIQSNGNASESGYIGPDCAYFDAIEALDFYVPLKDKEASRA